MYMLLGMPYFNTDCYVCEFPYTSWSSDSKGLFSRFCRPVVWRKKSHSSVATSYEVTIFLNYLTAKYTNTKHNILNNVSDSIQ